MKKLLFAFLVSAGLMSSASLVIAAGETVGQSIQDLLDKNLITDRNWYQERDDSGYLKEKTLNLGSLGISSLDGLQNIPRIKYATTIDLSKNQITEIPEGIFDGLDQLRNLYLNRNQISQITDTTFDGAKELGSVRLDGNPIRQSKKLDSLIDWYFYNHEPSMNIYVS